MPLFGSSVDKVLHSSSDFHHFLTSRVIDGIPKFYVALIRSTRFDDNSRLVFTHADLVDRNHILLSKMWYPRLGMGRFLHWEFVQFMRNTGWKIGVGGDRVIKEFPEYADVYLAFDVLKNIQLEVCLFVISAS